MRFRRSSRLFVVWMLSGIVLSAGLPGIASGAQASAEASRVQSLDGEWRVVLDPTDAGKTQGWFKAGAFPLNTSRAIQVPGNIYEVEPGYDGVFWCGRTFTPSIPNAPGLRQYLRFGAVGYACEIWLNHAPLGSHEGGQSPFELDVTGRLLAGQPNHLTVRIGGPYIAIKGGISQHVTLVAQPVVRIKDAFAKSDLQTGRIQLLVTLENNSTSPATVVLSATYGQYKPSKTLGTETTSATVAPGVVATPLAISIDKPQPWDLDNPFLYTIQLTTDWAAAPSADARHDTCSVRTGFRDFRIVDGYFQLNSKRIYPKSAHANWYDPISIYGTPRNMEYIGRDFAILKNAGFNMFRFIVAAAMPEQLDLADELGFLIYSEHETAWLQEQNTKFGISLNEVVRRDRNHPSLVIWGLLNETNPGRFYDAAKAWLPSLRAIDDTRLVLLNSGRWDRDMKTASASNPGSTVWDQYLGGEGPTAGSAFGGLGDDPAAYRDRGGAGDVHVYQKYPSTWGFIEAFTELGRNIRPVFVSEGGIGSSYNALRDQRKMQQAGAPKNAFAWRWITPAVQGMEKAWSKYRLQDLYPSAEQVFIDSELNAARQRELMFNIVRSNPKINGYSLTSIVDCWGAAEGIMDGFREIKPGHLPVLQAGWAKLRWCLFVNPMHGYADRPFRVRVALACEDALSAGVYPATLRITGPQGVVWEKAVSVTVPAGPMPPLAYVVFDEDVAIPGLTEGTWKLSATFTARANATSSELSFFVSERARQPRGLGPITVLGVGQPVREFLTAHGATLRDYAPAQDGAREVILVGDKVAGDTEAAVAATWQSLYARVARGAHAIFLSPDVFAGSKDPRKWFALGGSPSPTIGSRDWLYHKDVIAKAHPCTAGLQTKIMTPDYYGEILSDTMVFRDLANAGEAVAVFIYCTSYPFQFQEGVMLGTYNHQAGKLTLNAFQLARTLGHPAADRLLLNIITHARTTAAPRADHPPK